MRSSHRIILVLNAPNESDPTGYLTRHGRLKGTAKQALNLDL